MKPRKPRLSRFSRHRIPDPALVLRGNPVLLLDDPPAAPVIEQLLHEWNPAAEFPQIADGVRWAGPFHLDEEACDRAGLVRRWSTAYAALSVRSRTRVPEGLDAKPLRLRYPHGMPTGAEALAWSLVTGLARRLGGAARLPAGSHRAAESALPRRPRAQEHSYCVYGHEPLPWSVLRSVLCPSLPELDRNGMPSPDGYCLDRPGVFEVRVRPFRLETFVPYALRPKVVQDWPRTVYRFRCLPQAGEPEAERVTAQLRNAACQLADLVGGVLLDGDGFPVATVAAAGASAFDGLRGSAAAGRGRDASAVGV